MVGCIILFFSSSGIFSLRKEINIINKPLCVLKKVEQSGENIAEFEGVIASHLSRSELNLEPMPNNCIFHDMEKQITLKVMFMKSDYSEILSKSYDINGKNFCWYTGQMGHSVNIFRLRNLKIPRIASIIRISIGYNDYNVLNNLKSFKLYYPFEGRPFILQFYYIIFIASLIVISFLVVTFVRISKDATAPHCINHQHTPNIK